MRAIAMTGYESGVALYGLPEPEPAPNALLVRVHASSVNRIDVLIAGGLLKGMMEYEFPAVPERDFAGTAEQVGSEASRFEAGDDVFSASQHKAFLARSRMFVVEHRGSPGRQRLEPKAGKA